MTAMVYIDGHAYKRGEKSQPWMRSIAFRMRRPSSDSGSKENQLWEIGGEEKPPTYLLQDRR
jgi:hypothetical protein